MNTIFNQTIIDPHIHLWDLEKNKYDWINNSSNKDHKKSYLLDDFNKDANALNLKKIVHIQAEINRELSLLETQWLQSIADKNRLGFPNAIIGFIDFTEDNSEIKLEQHMQYANFRGVRQILKYNSNNMKHDLDLLNNSKWIKNLNILQKNNLSFDLLINHYQYKDAANVINKNPNLQFIINHALWPIDVSNDNFEAWGKSVKTLSAYENVCIKLSGFGERYRLSNFEEKNNTWDVKSIRPFIEFCIEKFGIERCMFGTNFPVDKVFSSKAYCDYWYGYHTIIENYNLEEKDSLFYKNAEKFYRI